MQGGDVLKPDRYSGEAAHEKKKKKKKKKKSALLFTDKCETVKTPEIENLTGSA
jgi:hypothetical protein